MVWLDKHEAYFPSDIQGQIDHTHPTINFNPVAGAPSPLNVNNLGALNSLGAGIYLSSNDDFTTNPSWLAGIRPDSNAVTQGIKSCAIITTDHGNGAVDAYYMYFYAYNQGNTIFGQEAGDHVGDWEHNMVRFANGTPTAIWYSQHAAGQAFQYSAVEKLGQRPVSYSARGSHANYAQGGSHDHTIPGVNLPFGLLVTDHTSQGSLWDPTRSAYVYSYNPASGAFTPYDGISPTSWLDYVGAWGDQGLPKTDKRQSYILGIAASAKFTGGPDGPRSKDLNRVNVCPAGKSCEVHEHKIAKRDE
jgi:hypothetical protein